MATTGQTNSNIGSTLNPQSNKDYTVAVNEAAVVQRRVASGQITITDLNDGKMVQSYTTASLGDTQVFKPDTKVYTPDYTHIDESNTAHPQVVSAKIFMSGQSIDLAPTAACTGWVWKVDGSSSLPTWAKVNASSPNQLVINKNIEAGPGLMIVDWACEVTDPETKMKVPVAGSKTLSLVESSGATGLVVIEQPFGNTFSSGGAITQLTGEARLMRGSTHDKTVTSAKWEALDITDGTWKTVTKGVVALADGVSKITVEPGDVLNFQTFRCTMVDAETGESFTNNVTFLDASDPYMVELYTLTGDVIKNGEGSTTVYARLWRNGEVLEDGQSVTYNYGWSKFNANGDATAWSDTTGCILNNVVKFGNPVVVKAADVVNKATLYCNVTKKM